MSTVTHVRPCWPPQRTLRGRFAWLLYVYCDPIENSNVGLYYDSWALWPPCQISLSAIFVHCDPFVAIFSLFCGFWALWPLCQRSVSLIYVHCDLLWPFLQLLRTVAIMSEVSIPYLCPLWPVVAFSAASGLRFLHLEWLKRWERYIRKINAHIFPTPRGRRQNFSIKKKIIKVT